MKKIVIVFSLIFAFAAFAHASDPVSSANIVGYVQKELAPSSHLILVGSSFESSSGTPTLLSIFGTNQLSQHAVLAFCDKIYLWDVQEQNYVSFAQHGNQNFYYVTNWNGEVVNDYSVPLGTALWVQSSVTATETNAFTFSGDVPMYDAITNQIPGSGSRPLSFVSNPYPVAISIHDLINTSDGATAHNVQALADKIYSWDVEAQRYVTLGLKGDNQWHYSTNWSGAAATMEIDVGEGFWYEALNSFGWVEDRNF